MNLRNNKQTCNSTHKKRKYQRKNANKQTIIESEQQEIEQINVEDVEASCSCSLLMKHAVCPHLYAYNKINNLFL